MQELSITQMAELTGGGRANTICGIAVGATIGASVLFGGIGFALTINKAVAACTVAALT